MVVTKVGRRGQMTIPKEIQRRLQIREGDRIAFVQKGQEIVLRPLTRTLLDLRGSVRECVGLTGSGLVRREACRFH